MGGPSIERIAQRMISLTPSTRIFAAVEPADMRLGFNGLCGKVRNFLNEDPTSGALFLFTNRRRNRLKMLYFDGSGLWVCTKRLESATFGWPTGDGPARLLRPEELSLLIHGIQGQSRPRWHRK